MKTTTWAISASIALAVVATVAPSVRANDQSLTEKHRTEVFKACGSFPDMKAYGFRSLASADTDGNQLGVTMWSKEREKWTRCMEGVSRQFDAKYGKGWRRESLGAVLPSGSCLSVADMDAAARGVPINKICTGGQSIFIQRH